MRNDGPREAYRPRSKENRLCFNCGNAFETTRADAKTCSPRCRAAFSRAIKKAMADNGTTEKHG